MNMKRTRQINGRKCMMVEGSSKYSSEQEAADGAKNELKLEDFEIAQTGLATWRVYTSDEPKVEKKPRAKKAKEVESEEDVAIKAENEKIDDAIMEIENEILSELPENISDEEFELHV